MDSEVFFIQSSKVEGFNAHVPEPVVDFFKTDVFLGKEVADIDPVGVPADRRDVFRSSLEGFMRQSLCGG